MKSIKKLFLIFLIVAFSLSLIGCNSNNEILNVNESNDIKISLVSSESQSNSDEVSYTVKVISDYITDDFYDWEVKWANPNSDWASKDVADYIEISLYGYYHDSALITCKQAFGCQVEIICYLSSNPNVKDTLVCDYKNGFTDGDLILGERRINNRNYSVSGGGYNYSAFDTCYLDSCTFEPKMYTTGTVLPTKDDIKLSSFKIYLNDSFYEELNSAVPGCSGSEYVSESNEIYKYIQIKTQSLYYQHLIFNFIDSVSLAMIKSRSTLTTDYKNYCTLLDKYVGNQIGFVDVEFTVGKRYYAFRWNIIVTEFSSKF